MFFFHVNSPEVCARMENLDNEANKTNQTDKGNRNSKVVCARKYENNIYKNKDDSHHCWPETKIIDLELIRRSKA
jgi:hypothetical protein